MAAYVIVEMTVTDQAKKWWTSPEYRAACEIRNRSAKTRMILVEGVA